MSLIKNLYRFLSPKYQNVFLDYKVDMKPRYGHGLPPHGELLRIIAENDETYKDLLQEALTHKEIFWSLNEAKDEQDAALPVWNNGFLPGLDIIMIYTILSKYKPSSYVEVGSGNSTKVAYKAKSDQQLDMTITSIDPYPRAEIDQLVDKVIREPFENMDMDMFSDLKENDVLFIDNSHRILPNSDSMAFYLDVLPRLSKGVIVHIHDIYLPYDYPQFMCDRYYSEQYGLAMYLLANPKKYQTLAPNYYLSEQKELSSILAPIWADAKLSSVERHGGSFWLRIAE